METVESVLRGPMLYLLIAWGIVTAVFIVLVAWRSVLTSHEDDQIFLIRRRSHGERQHELVAKINKLSKPHPDQRNHFRGTAAVDCRNLRCTTA